MTCLVFKTTCIDREKPLREGAFFFVRMALFPPLDKRNTRDKAKGLVYHFGEAYPPVLERDEMPRTAVYQTAYRIIP